MVSLGSWEAGVLEGSEGEKTFEARFNAHNLLPIHYIW